MAMIYDDKTRTAEALEKIAGIKNETNIHYQSDKRIAMAVEKIAESGIPSGGGFEPVLVSFTSNQDGRTFSCNKTYEELNAHIENGDLIIAKLPDDGWTDDVFKTRSMSGEKAICASIVRMMNPPDLSTDYYGVSGRVYIYKENGTIICSNHAGTI